jgi:hypothetical protein
VTNKWVHDEEKIKTTTTKAEPLTCSYVKGTMNPTHYLVMTLVIEKRKYPMWK